MPRSSPDTRRQASLSMRLGGWFEANATGWGVLAVPLVLALLLGFAAIRIVWP
jgi:hypothetical protein